MKKKSLGADNNSIGGILEIIKFKNGKEVSRDTKHNIVVNSENYGKNLLLKHFSGDNTYPLYIDEFCIGTSNQTPSIADTNLIAPVVTGLAITKYTISGSSLIMEIYVADGDLPDGTYREFGFKNDGRLFSRVVPSEYSKSTGEDTLFIYTLSI